MNDVETGGMVFNIQKYSVHDGPGIRTIVFFKGCPLRCAWCGNPESQSFMPELAFNKTRCVSVSNCGKCLGLCQENVLSGEKEDLPCLPDSPGRSDCGKSCDFACAGACHSGALNIFGKKMLVDEIMAEVEKDGVFYQRSSGGLTVSGGEPLGQPEFLMALLGKASENYMDLAMETCGHAPYKPLAAAAELLDTLIFDVKHIDPEAHKQGTGMDNSRILDNLKRVAADFPDLKILARTPVIPGFNDSEKVIAAICEFIKPLGGCSYELLPYHRLGTQKYAQLGRPYPLGDVRLDKEKFKNLCEIAKKKLGERCLN